MASVLQMDRVSCRYIHQPEQAWAIREASLEIHEGECVLISGPSGGGKTTLLRALVNRPLTNTLSGLIEGVVGSFVLPIGMFGLIALPAQGFLLDAVFGWRRVKPTRFASASLAGALAGMLFVFLVVYVFFEVRKPFPLVASLLGGAAGAVSGVIGCLIARRAARVGLLTPDVVGSSGAVKS